MVDEAMRLEQHDAVRMDKAEVPLNLPSELASSLLQ